VRRVEIVIVSLTPSASMPPGKSPSPQQNALLQHAQCATPVITATSSRGLPGSYKLVNNLTFNGPAGGTCLSITTSFVTIDLAGFAITHPPGNNNPFITTAEDDREEYCRVVHPNGGRTEVKVHLCVQLGDKFAGRCMRALTDQLIDQYCAGGIGLPEIKVQFHLD
jgi:hypothetical protein